MLKKLSIFLIITQLALAQNEVFKVNYNSDIFLTSLKEKNLENTSNGVKFKLSFLNNETIFVANKLLYDSNENAKVFSYFKEYGVVVIRYKDSLEYLTINEAFPKGFFYKDASSKTIFDKKVQGWVFGNENLNLKIWTSTAFATNELTDNLRKIGFLNNLPENENVIAFSYNNVEFTADELKKENESTHYLLSDVCTTFYEKNKAYLKCKQQKDSLTTKIEYKNFSKTIDFTYSVTNNRMYYDKKGKIIVNDTITELINSENTSVLMIYNDRQSKIKKYRYYNLNDAVLYDCEKNGTELKITNAESFTIEDICTTYNPYKKMSKNGAETVYFTGRTDEFSIIKLIVDESYPDIKNINSPNGFIKEQLMLTKDLGTLKKICTIEKTNQTYTLIAK
ncbi:hypothetical protein [Flavobacterium sp.]|uniref:hypothetical protein n=1 Tax=Flavobacterium sp. TaxID=239 RepID=UPI0035275C8D